MDLNNLHNRLRHYIFMLLHRSVQWPRILFYRALSSGCLTNHGANIYQPVLILGKGKVILNHCNLGVTPSPNFFSGYIHIEAREATARVEIEDGVWLNNNVTIIAERKSIRICKNTLIGTEVAMYDSDFHDLNPERRMMRSQATAPVKIGENVFIGSRVTVLKGAEIGNNSVIGSGSTVVKPIPANVIAAGVPARIIRPL